MDKSTTRTDAQKRVAVKLSSDRLTATVNISRSVASDAPVSHDEIYAALESAGVMFGINDAAIESVLQSGFTEGPLEIAHGEPASPGENASLEFKFNTNPFHAPQSDSSGRIDYHEVNFIQGVHAGDVLVVKTPARSGQPGTGVDGGPILSQPGKDKALPLGAGTRISDDGLKLIAINDGVISFAQGKVSVKDVADIKGDVDFSVGNVHSPACVRIAGNVHGGFKIHADGDVEIGGYVEDAQIVSHGNVLVKGGFIGRGEGMIRADGNVTVKYVEGQSIHAGHDIIIGGDSLNARMIAGTRIVVNNPTGHLHGGDAQAGKEIVAPVLGSEVWTPTYLRVAADVNLAHELRESRKEYERLTTECETVRGKVYHLAKQNIDGRLSPMKVELMLQLKEVLQSMQESVDTIKSRIAELESSISESVAGRIVATKQMHPGVRLCFGELCYEINEERGPTLSAQNDYRIDVEPLDLTKTKLPVT